MMFEHFTNTGISDTLFTHLWTLTTDFALIQANAGSVGITTQDTCRKFQEKTSEILLELNSYKFSFFNQKTWFLVNEKSLCNITYRIFQCRIIIFKQ